MTPNLLLLYVADPLSSAPFYEALFGRPPTAAFSGRRASR